MAEVASFHPLITQKLTGFLFFSEHFTHREIGAHGFTSGGFAHCSSNRQYPADCADVSAGEIKEGCMLIESVDFFTLKQGYDAINVYRTC